MESAIHRRGDGSFRQNLCSSVSIRGFRSPLACRGGFRHLAVAMSESQLPQSTSAPNRRRPRYRGKNPRRFEEKYKEHNPARYAETVVKVIASGKTPAGSHRPIMVTEMVELLSPQ